MLSKLETLFRKIPVKFRWAAFVLIAFASFGSFITSTSYYADRTHTNTLFTVLGIVLALITLGIFKIANDESKQDRK
jgi:uncharacterized membrane protein YphA (DoxX/SURF4 family)